MNDDTGSGDTAHDPTGSTAPVQPPGRRLSPPLIAALVLGVALVVVVAVAGIVAGPGGSRAPAASTARPANPTGPLLLVPVEAPRAGSPDCAALLRKLPATLANGNTPLSARQLAKPAPPAAAAWGGRNGDPVVLRCGIERPPELTPTSELLEVSGVRWLRVSADGLTTWYAVDRPVVVALTLPGDVGTGPIQDVSDTIGATLPARKVF
ncbi:MAG TPA: DUF3515 domain-containing protein [Pseudonocardiaceae bacterium]|nr:DUF3515 domain-containing protein [Pseudonocardiaceae bacterium]